VLEQHNLVSYQSLGVDHSLILAYDSSHADARPIVRVGYAALGPSSLSSFAQNVLMARLIVQAGGVTYVAPGYTGTQIAGLSGGEQFWDVPVGGGDAYAPFQVDLSADPTGVYNYTEQTGFFGFGGTRMAVAGSFATTKGQIFLVNSSASPFGSGWDLAGLQTLYPASDGSVMLVDGGGRQYIFQPPATSGGAYVSQAGDFSTLVRLGDGTYQRTLPDHTIDHFDAMNRLSTVTDRDGNVFTYAYDSSGHLASLTDPVGLVTMFTYTGNHVTAITDPAGRTTQLAFDAAGNLVRITDPDGSHVDYRYDDQHHLIGETDQVGNQSQDSYDVFGRAESSIRKDGSMVTFNPVATQGLHVPGTPFDPFNAPLAGTNTATYADGNGHVATMRFNSAASLILKADSGGSNTLMLDANHLPTTTTDGNGYQTVYTYDARGNQTSVSNVFNGSISGQIVNPGDRFVYTFKGTPGQRLFYLGQGTSSGNIISTLVSPSGANIFSTSSTSSTGPYELTETGTYQITVSGSGGTTGAFQFQVLAPILSISPLTVGTPVAGTLKNPGDEAAYTFSGTPGERLFYNPSTTYAGGQRVRLYAPDGSLIVNDNWSNPQGTLILTQSGTYRLLLSGDNTTVGSYQFVVTNPALTTTPLTLGAAVIGTLAKPGDEASYTFSGTPGERIYYAPTTTYAGGQRIRLYDPAGNLVFNDNWSNAQGALVLLLSGTYRLLFSGDGATVGTYNFTLSNPAFTTTPLTLGTPVSGTLANPGDQAEYTFTGTPGERLFYAPTTTYAGGQRVRLFTPGGTLLFNNNWSSDEGPIVLTQAGTYRLVFSGDSATTGSFQFTLSNPKLTTAPLTLGTAVSGALANPGDEAEYTFDATVGQRLFYDPTTTVVSGQRVVLYTPGGASLFNNNWSFDEGPLVLTQAGTYRLVFSGDNGTTGTYNFTVTSPAVTTAPLTLGTATTNTIASPGEVFVYTFTGSPGQRLFYDATTSVVSNQVVQLFAPSNDLVFNANWSSDQGPFLLTQAGTYRLVLYGASAATGTFAFRLLDLATVPALTLGPTSGTINPGTAVVAYQVNGTRGQRLLFNSLASGNANWTLYDSGDQVVPNGSTSLGNSFTVTLPAAAVYTLILSGFDAKNPVAYSFQTSDVSDPPQTPSGFGVVHTGNIAAGVADTYSYTAPAGLAVALDGQTASPSQLVIDLLDPSNQVISSTNAVNDTGTIVLQRGGTYTVRVHGSSATSTGSYSFNLLDLAADSGSLTPGTPLSGTIPAEQFRTFQFTGNAGQRLYFDALGGSGLNAELDGPAGTVFNVNPANSSGPYTLPVSATYTLRISNFSAAAGTYNLNLLSATTTLTPLTLGTPVSGTLANPGDQAIYTFNGTAGDHIFYNATATPSGSLNVFLQSPSQTFLFSQTAGNQIGPITLPESGAYQLLISGNGVATGTFAFNLLKALVTVAPLTLNTPTTANLANPGDQAIYTFSGTAGDRIFYNATATPVGSLNAFLQSPSGTFLFSQSAGNQIGPIVLPESGSYQLVISGNGAAVGSASFNLRMAAASLTPLTLGTPITGALANPGDQAIYTFSGTTGDRIYFHTTAAPTGSLNAFLQSPSGTFLFSQDAGNQIGPVILPESGSYQLVISGNDNGAATGTFAFNLLLTVAPTSALTLGTPVTGALANPGDQAIYTFTSTAGDRVFYSPTAAPGGSLNVFLQSPSGTFLFDQSAGNKIGPILLPESGLYQLVVLGNGAATGSFGFTLRDVVDTQVATPLTVGTPTTGSISNLGDIVTYLFSGTAGQRIYYDALGPNVPSLTTTFTSPSGQYVASTNVGDEDAFTLSETGTYQVVISGGGLATGSYAFRLLDAALATTISIGSTITDTLNPGLGDALYQFAGKANQRLYFKALGTDTHGRWDLYSSTTNPVYLTGAGLTTDLEVTLPRDGTYLLVITGQQTSGAPVNYSFQVTAPDTPVTPLTLGATVQGTLAQPGSTATYTFNGLTGQRLLYDALQNNSLPINVVLTSPSGSTLFGGNIGTEFDPLTLAESGTYSLTITGNGATTGSYAFRLLDLAAAPALPLAASVSGTLNPGQKDDVYRINGTAGQRLSFVSQTTASGTWTVYGLANQTLGNTTLSNSFTTLFPADGTYFLVVRGGNTSAAVNYQFLVTDISDAPTTPAGFGMVQSGSIAAAQQMTFSFTAPAGLPVYYNGLAGTSPLLADLRDPAGNAIFTSQSAGLDSGPYILPRAGTYVLTIRGNSATATGNYQFQLLDLNAVAAPLSLGTPTSATLTPSLSVAAYNLTVPVGKRVIYDALTTTSTGVRAILYSASGTAVFNTDANNDVAPQTLLEGSYHLILQGNQATSAYAFQLVDASVAPALPIDVPAVTGTLTPGVSTAAYTIAANAGDRLYLHVATSPGAGNWVVYAPNGQAIASTSLSTDLTATLATRGTYLLVLYGGKTSGPLAYSFSTNLANTFTSAIPTSATASGISTTTYDPTFGMVTSETDALGHQTLYQIDPNNGNVLSETRVAGSGTGNVVTQFIYDAHGRPTKIVDPLGHETDYAYDPSERLITITYAVGTADQASQHYEYNSAGKVTAFIDENGQRTEYTFDPLNRVTSVKDPLGHVTSYTYDQAGDLLATTDPLSHVTTNAYDPYGHVIETTDAAGNHTFSTYDAAGNLTSVTDALGHVTRSTYDARNRLVSTIDAAGGITRQVYDASDNLVAVIDPNGNRTQYSYDSLNRLIQSVDALGNSVVYEYDAVDHVTARTDRDNRRVEYTYDNLDRLISETWISPSGGTANVINYAYDADGNLLSTHDATSALTFTYDNRNRVASVDNTGTAGVPEVLLTYTYDAVGHVHTVAESIGGQPGATTTYTYDAAGNTTAIVQSGPGVAPKVVDLGYDANGALTSINRFSDTAGTQLVARSTYAYDPVGHILSLTHTDPTSATIAAYTLQYNAVGGLIRVTDGSGTTTYTYDPTNQLASVHSTAAGTADVTYGYDPGGNRVSAGQSTATIGQGNRLLTDGTYNYTYDNEGNLTRRTEIATGNYRVLTWDYRNRLTSVADFNAAGTPVQRVSYTYDPLNRLITEDVNTAPSSSADGVVTSSIYDRNEVLLRFVDPDGSGPAPATFDRRYLHGPILDQILAEEDATGKVLWPLTDAVGSVRDVVDNTGKVVNHIVYDAYGKVVSQTNPGVGLDYGFQGHQYDSATGLDHVRARFYDPATGRFLSEDPAGPNGNGPNLYRFVGNQPTISVDPTGLSPATRERCASAMRRAQNLAEECAERERELYEGRPSPGSGELSDRIPGKCPGDGLNQQPSLSRRGHQALLNQCKANLAAAEAEVAAYCNCPPPVPVPQPEPEPQPQPQTNNNNNRDYTPYIVGGLVILGAIALGAFIIGTGGVGGLVLAPAG
jgi:RHS repeat-associated protein